MAHEIRHAVDDDHGSMLLFIAIKRGDQPGRVFTIHNMNGEDHVRSLQVSVDLEPHLVTHRRAKVVRRNLQIEIVFAIDLALRLFQRRQQTRADVEYGNLHTTLSSGLSGWPAMSRSLSTISSSGFQYPRVCASSRRFVSERAECGFISSRRLNMIGSSTNVLEISV